MGKEKKWWPWALAGVVFLVFSQAGGNGFINYDDDAYILTNAHVRGGLTWDNFVWALTNWNYFYWQPLTWISHQLDVTLFGLSAGPMHLESALLHAANAALCFLVLRRLAGSAELALAGAALWALHPLRVESVAWAAERKDVLSGLFGLLATLSYLERRPMWRTTLFFALGLMAKPAVVFLPLALLLFDYWPLRRWALWEKWPLFAAAAVSSLITVQGQDAFGATKALGDVPFTLRMGHALTNTALYLWRTVWPSGLAVVYPYDFGLASWKPAAAALVLAALTGVAWFWRTRWPAVAAGWGWYLLALGPVSGVIQAGPQSGADRFTYLPAVGLMLALTAAGARILPPGLAVAAVCAYLSFAQIGHWKDSVTVFTHAVEVTEDNWIAQRNLGNGLIAAGRVPEGIAEFRKSLQLRPNQPETCYQLGSALVSRGAWAEAVPYFERSLALKPDYGSAQFALGLALLQTGRQNEAKPALEKSLQLELADNYKADAHNNLGVLEAMRGDAVVARWHFREAVRLNPAMTGAKQNLQRVEEQLKVK